MSPYKIKGKDVMKLENGSWKVKEHTKSHANAIKAVHLLYGIESGKWKPTRGKK